MSQPSHSHYARRMANEIEQSQLDARRRAALERRENRRWWFKTLLVVAALAAAAWLVIWMASGQALPAL